MKELITLKSGGYIAVIAVEIEVSPPYFFKIIGSCRHKCAVFFGPDGELFAEGHTFVSAVLFPPSEALTALKGVFGLKSLAALYLYKSVVLNNAHIFSFIFQKPIPFFLFLCYN